MVLLGVGQGLVGPSVSGLLSRITPMSEQGAVFGTLSSAQTLARMISYSTSNVLLGKVSTAAPYWGAVGVDLVALALGGQRSPRDFIPKGWRFEKSRSMYPPKRFRVSVAVAGHHRFDRLAVSKQHLHAFDQGLGANLQQPLGEVVAEHRPRRDRFRS